MKPVVAVAVALTFVWQCALPLGAVAGEMSAGSLAAGKDLFEKKCSGCHEIERPLARDMERPEWEKLLIGMASRGADMQDSEKELILDYLEARHVFTVKCTGCHTKEKILDRERAFKDWVSTVQEMALKSPDLMSEEESAAIVNYLTLILGPQP